MASSAAPDPQIVQQTVAAGQSAEAAGQQQSQMVPPQLPVPLPDAEAGFDSGFENELPSAAEDGLVGRTLEVDSEGDRDSAIGEDATTVASSLASSTTSYRYEHGRRYHGYKDGKYHLPNDQQEIDRLEIQHQIWYITLNGKLGLAPIPDHTHNVLDVGCGTGSWAIDFATAYPSANVIGTDLSPIQPTAVPPNCQFIVDDVTSEWAFQEKFDYIHVRMISVAIRDWDYFLDQCVNALKPGGYLEFQEWSAPFGCDDGSAPLDSPFMRWGSDGKGAAVKAGIDTGAANKLPGWFRHRGLEDVNNIKTKWPIGPWPKGKKEKRIGRLFLRDMLEALKASSLGLYTRVLGWSEEQLDEFLEEVKEDMVNPQRHCYMPIHICYARKPLT